MPLEIPELDLQPRLLTFAMRDGEFSFPLTPHGSPVMWLITGDTCTTVPAKDWFDVDLEMAAEFCRAGSAFTIHTKRILALLAWWRALRGDARAKDWQRTFLATTDLCESFYGGDIYLSMDDRRNFTIPTIAKVLDLEWSPYQAENSEEVKKQAQKILITLCQRIHSGP